MTTAPLLRRWRPFLLKPSTEKIEYLITLLDDVHFTACGALDWFKATLIRANVAIDGVGDEQFTVWLTRGLLVWIEYRRGDLFERPTVAGPSKELLELNAALSKWLDASLTPPEMILGYDHAVAELFNASTALIDNLEACKKKTRGEAAETRLQLGLYYLYVAVTGEDGLSDGGPAHWFVKTLAAEIDESLDVPEKGFAGLVRKARNRLRDRLDEV